MTKPPSRMRAAREARGLTQLNVAVMTGLSPATIHLAERFGTGSTATHLKISEILGVGPDELFGNPGVDQGASVGARA